AAGAAVGAMAVAVAAAGAGVVVLTSGVLVAAQPALSNNAETAAAHTTLTCFLVVFMRRSPGGVVCGKQSMSALRTIRYVYYITVGQPRARTLGRVRRLGSGLTIEHF
ncbi:MAG: hypothetical protein QFF03_08260, partial [Pseudomonadota bacterium]|nr:hypothetical protein [Pseudomonadota bacterium]